MPPGRQAKEQMMSNRLPIVDNLCTNPENHRQHMCELKAAQKTAEVEQLQQDPRFICGNCAALANRAGALCAPGPWQE